jgi:hypothetical protein
VPRRCLALSTAALQNYRVPADIHYAMEHPDPAHQPQAAAERVQGSGATLALGGATVVMLVGLVYVIMFGSPLHRAAAAPRLSREQQAYVEAVATQRAADYIQAVATQQSAALAQAQATVEPLPAAHVVVATPVGVASQPAAAAPAAPPPPPAAPPPAEPPTPTISDENCLYRAQQLEEVAPILKGDPDFDAAVAEHADLCADWIRRTGWVLQYDCGGPDYPVPHAGCALAHE